MLNFSALHIIILVRYMINETRQNDSGSHSLETLEGYMAAQQALLYVLYMKDKEFIRDMKKEYINMNVFDALQKRFEFLLPAIPNIIIPAAWHCSRILTGLWICRKKGY